MDKFFSIGPVSEDAAAGSPTWQTVNFYAELERATDRFWTKWAEQEDEQAHGDPGDETDTRRG